MNHPHQKISVHPKTGRPHVETINDEPTMTQQQFKDECDINKIMEKYNKTGEFAAAILRNGQYADFSSITDYHDMCNTVAYAQEAFMLLPANVRSQFKNDPGQLLSFLQDDKNYDEAKRLGLLDLAKVQQQEEIKNNAKTQKRDQKQSSKTKNIEPDSSPSDES